MEAIHRALIILFFFYLKYISCIIFTRERYKEKKVEDYVHGDKIT